jgi:LmbE family N-acetylglucosaminyl deacetylase
MRWIYLSPHLDDVVLSVGGLVWEQTLADETVEIWTVFAGDPPPPPYTPFAQELHERWGTSGENAAAVRRAEDAAACQVLAAGVRHAALPDCIYRRLPGSQQPVIGDRDDLFRPFPPGEAYLVPQIAAWIQAGIPESNISNSEIFRPGTGRKISEIKTSPSRGEEERNNRRGDFATEGGKISQNSLNSSPFPSGKGAGGLGSSEIRFVSPMALGGHIDHRLVRAAAESLGASLWYYADYPYAVEDPLTHEDLRGKTAAYLPSLVQGLSPQAVSAWQSAVAAYVSQISTFWGSLEEMRARIAAYHLEGGGCVLWQPRLK